tara:strand:- start:607 stop:813 length:207 start_codon:yes stop_codon:yes gene_type:complete
MKDAWMIIGIAVIIKFSVLSLSNYQKKFNSNYQLEFDINIIKPDWKKDLEKYRNKFKKNKYITKNESN